MGPLSITLLPGARELLERQQRELPQRDDLCGAFCGALALRATGVRGDGDGALDQDAVALAAGSVVCAIPHAGLPGGETGRRDYRLQIPLIEDEARSGTAAAGVQRAIEQLSGGALRALPLAAPWTPATLDALFDALVALAQPSALIANHATRYLWGSHPSPPQLLGYLLDGSLEGPAPDWDVGHFACIAGAIEGPRGRLYALADTYPALGFSGLHLQPRERLAAALQRREMPSGGMLVVVGAEHAGRVAAAAAGAGLQQRIWDNGSAISEGLR